MWQAWLSTHNRRDKTWRDAQEICSRHNFNRDICPGRDPEPIQIQADGQVGEVDGVSHPKLVSKPTLFILPGQNPPTPHTSTHTHTENRPPTLMKSTAQSLSSEARSLQITECRVTASPHYHHTHPAPPCRTRPGVSRHLQAPRACSTGTAESPHREPQALHPIIAIITSLEKCFKDPLCWGIKAAPVIIHGLRLTEKVPRKRKRGNFLVSDR
ncbi:hypothetical protein EYC84_004156 [Monilinia fructicola]|uniref:Uncharacterized protein n=1 Tax=Monilinia fructicola TaxID=38448 RepID=A0A5M9K384_MONFR|nr:hypothetical protein EYC84_004156 [Monilinia fructicola]